jgi:hypothetical protein
MKICTLKFFRCLTTQSTHGNTLEAKESKKNSKAIELNDLNCKG